MKPTEIIAVFLLGTIACQGTPPAPQKPGLPEPTACISHDDCSVETMCLHGQCIARPPAPSSPAAVPAEIAVTPQVLSFGTVAPGGSRRLPVIVDNVGAAVVTLEAHVEPGGGAFAVEPMGSGPFWVRPGRSRPIYVRFAPSQPGVTEATLILDSQAGRREVRLSGS